MKETNWELLRFKYEVLGASLEDLATEHTVSLPVLEYNSKNWKQIPLSKESSISPEDITSIEDVIEKLGSQTITQSKAFQILKQKFLGGKYVELETIILTKTIEVASALSSDDARAASVLKTLTATLVELLNQNPFLAPSLEDTKPDEVRKWEVTVVDNKPKPEEND